MNANQKVSESPPNKAAVICGRIVFFIAGFAAMVIPMVLAYEGLEIPEFIAWLSLIVGILLMILGAILPPKIVAEFGFGLPFFLPSDV